MSQPVILPQNLANAAHQQAIAQAQARAVIEGLACGIFERLAVEEQGKLDSTPRDQRLQEHADYAVQAAVVMGQKLGYCRRSP